jgi:hypothetical protein
MSVRIRVGLGEVLGFCIWKNLELCVRGLKGGWLVEEKVVVAEVVVVVVVECDGSGGELR